MNFVDTLSFFLEKGMPAEAVAIVGFLLRINHEEAIVATRRECIKLGRTEDAKYMDEWIECEKAQGEINALPPEKKVMEVLDNNEELIESVETPLKKEDLERRLKIYLKNGWINCADEFAKKLGRSLRRDEIESALFVCVKRKSVPYSREVAMFISLQ